MRKKQEKQKFLEQMTGNPKIVDADRGRLADVEINSVRRQLLERDFFSFFPLFFFLFCFFPLFRIVNYRDANGSSAMCSVVTERMMDLNKSIKCVERFNSRTDDHLFFRALGRGRTSSGTTGCIMTLLGYCWLFAL